MAERPRPNETEPHPKVLVGLYGFNHHPFNLQAIPGLIANFRGVLAESTGRNVLFIESSEFTQTRANSLKERVREMGFASAIIWSTLSADRGYVPSNQQVAERIKQIAASDLETIIAKKLLPWAYLQRYFLSCEFDLLRERHEFTVEFENHSPETLSKIQSFQTDLLIDSLGQYWLNGDFKSLVETEGRIVQLDLQSSELREKDLLKELKRLVRGLLKNSMGGSLFLAFGREHKPLLDLLRNKLGTNVSARLINCPDALGETPLILIDGLLRKRQPPPDELLAQRALMLQLEAEIWRSNTNQALAFAYEIVDNQLSRIVLGLSLEQIRQLCEDKKDLLGFLRNHPQSGLIKPFLPLAQPTS